MRMRCVASVAAAVGMLALAGCATTSVVPRQSEPSGPAAAAIERPAFAPRYSAGRAMQDFGFPSSTVTAAVLEAMQDLNIVVTRRDHDGTASQIDGRTADNRGVTITLRPQKPITRVSCRVGWFGDELFSKALLRRVGIRLGTLPPEAIPEKPPSSPAANPYFSREAVSDYEMMRDYIEAPYRNRPDL